MLRTKIIINTFVNTSGKMLGFFLQLLIMTYLIRTIGKEAYGIVVLALSIAGNMNLLEAGFGLSVTKYTAEYKAKDDWKSLNEIINANFLVITFLAAIFCSALVLFNEFFLEKVFNIPVNMLNPAKVLIRLLILQTVLEFWSVSLMRIAEGFQRFTVIRSVEVLKWLLRAVFTVIAVEAGWGFYGIGMAYLAAGVITTCILHIAVFIYEPGLKFSITAVSRTSLSKLFSFSVWISLSKAFAFISYRINIFLIGIFLPPQNLTYYNIGFKIYEILKYGLSLVSSTLVPITSEIHVRVDIKKLSLLFRKASYYTALLIFPFIIFYIFNSSLIIRLWLGSGNEDAIILSQLLAGSVFFIALVSSGAEMMVGLNKLKKLIKYNAIGSLLNFIISLMLVRQEGAKGVVVGTLIGSIVLSIGYLYQMLKEFNITLPVFLKKIIIMPIILSSVLIFTSIVLDNIAANLVGLVIYFAAAFVIAVDKKDKESLLGIFKGHGTNK